MGVIEEGSVSGYIPSNEAFAVHYPAYPSSTARAIETLGGTQAIRKARGSQSNKLELHFRPEDPYSHPAFGELQPCNNLLLRISKKKSTDGQSAEISSKVSKRPPTDSTNPKQKICGSESAGSGQHGSQPEGESVATGEEVEAQISGEVPIRLCANIIARVSEAYHFNGMVDYQHVLPVHADVARRKKRNWAEVEPHLEKGDLVDVDQEDLMILLPPLFSPKDVPEKLVLRPSMTLNLKKKQEGVVQQRWEMGIEPCLAIDFEIKEIPKKVNWEQYIPKGSEQWEWQMAVSNLFDERPIWPKGALTERLLDKGLNVGDYTLRRYQRIDFRVPPSLRSYCDANAANGLKQRWEDICSFRVFPYKCHTSLQLFELADDYIQQEIRKPLKQTTCTVSFSCRAVLYIHTNIKGTMLSFGNILCMIRLHITLAPSFGTISYVAPVLMPLMIQNTPNYNIRTSSFIKS
ncbi:hypothetical protein PVL29_006954 [Vitis rotundifolia]|uniref:General transcription factor 3C polypeptide 5 n=1 Tax=Vitis rotundifolia TaxID=103349 RepID=A0AA39DZI8_VITRO|nr:hypothetical protein PVL29_006954 [Vitis rotundifolia]